MVEISYYMWRTIESMRQKPKAVRNAYAFALAAGFAVLLLVVWSLSLPDRVIALLQPTDTAGEQVPPSRLWTGLRDWGSGLQAAVIGADTVLESDTTGEQASGTATELPGVTGIDVAALRASSAGVTAAGTSTNGVWQREYPKRTGGQVVLIATSSVSTSSRASTTR